MNILLAHLEWSSRDADMASFTMTNLANMALPKDKRVIEALIPFITFEPAACSWVRKAAMRSLVVVAGSNDQRVLSMVALRLQDADPGVRAVALETCAQL